MPVLALSRQPSVHSVKTIQHQVVTKELSVLAYDFMNFLNYYHSLGGSCFLWSIHWPQSKQAMLSVVNLIFSHCLVSVEEMHLCKKIV